MRLRYCCTTELKHLQLESFLQSSISGGLRTTEAEKIVRTLAFHHFHSFHPQGGMSNCCQVSLLVCKTLGYSDLGDEDILFHIKGNTEEELTQENCAQTTLQRALPQFLKSSMQRLEEGFN